MIVDSSAIVAIALGEDGSARLIRALAAAERVRVGAPIWLEASIVLSNRLGPRLDTFLDGLVRQFRIETIPFDAEHSRAAYEAWARYGRGNSSAGLNFGDCMSYAIARTAGEPLLFVGRDFSLTDIEAA